MLNRVISILKNAATQVSFVNLSPEEEQRIEQLAEEIGTILERAAARTR